MLATYLVPMLVLSAATIHMSVTLWRGRPAVVMATEQILRAEKRKKRVRIIYTSTY